ncbi:rod shape-determining protein MreD [Halothiobacillus diazotrophicus]|uniref:Rod shape-determining protein MreD n=1 Tax=Halothiobacillus diazotrophicus TaxID=1860122 RepID=A0A191ZGG5_9GAMM|nr:rod shape-determining protein MreD [Halothiobacillus diazotrophicus]ANJ66976.1 rod shape-determining protein MreD [Halothiobacillus diazotrophicus]
MRGEWLAILLTTTLALVLTLVPFGDWYQQHAPQWLLLTVLYWCIHSPGRVGLVYAWLMGLLLDVGTAGLLGANALLFTLAAALVLALRQMLSVASPIQQALFIAGLSTVYLLFSLWIQGGITSSMALLDYLSRALANLLAWPVITLVFYLIRARLSRL